MKKVGVRKSEPLTFEEICELEPAIEKLFDLARMIGRRRGKWFCANAVWYHFFKPELTRLVGWGRRPTSSRIQVVSIADILAGKGRAGKRRDRPNPASSCRDPRLKSEDAYSTAYMAISSELPDCRGCMCL